MTVGPDVERRKLPAPWTWGGLTAVAVGVAVTLAAGQGGRPAGAQAVRAPRAAAFTYRPSNVLWTRMSETLNQWEAKGWEPYQVVPIASDNPGTGGSMQVAIIFRRDARVADR